MTNPLFVAWRSSDGDHGSWWPVGRLEHLEGVYRFVYTRGAQQRPGFRGFTGMADLDEVYESESLFPLFSNRLLGRSRPEYDAFLRWGGFPPGANPDPIAILAVSEGSRQTDSLEVFPCPTPDGDGRLNHVFFLHGIRWLNDEGRARVGELQAGERLNLLGEPSNPHDHDAVAVYTAATPDGVKIGYVPRYLARDTSTLLGALGSEGLRVQVDRINRDAPLQFRVLCRMQAQWPEGFRPCSGAEFEPIVDVAAREAA
ncbi:MAG: HIRAN domain-containing protein [Lysobacterales bacterium]